MGSTDIPPPGAPTWLVPVSTVCLAFGVWFWLATYVLMTRRSLQTKATPVPVLALGINLAWEIIWIVYVTDTSIEKLGFALWLLFDIPVLYATIRGASHSFASQPLIARHFVLILSLAFLWGLAANALFAWWWLKEPHRGHGLKWGKTWHTLEARDTTELSWWAAGAAQAAFSASALAMLLQRGHSGGQSYSIWFCRFAGTLMGLPVTNVLLWWYWPEAHGYVFHPVSIILIGTAFACDVAYPFVLASVRRTERIQPDGTILSGAAPAAPTKRE